MYDISGIKPQAYTEYPDLTGTGVLRQKASYIIRIHGPVEFYISQTESGATNGKAAKFPLIIEQNINGSCKPGPVYQIRITGFEKFDNADPGKTAHARACRNWLSFVAAVTGIKELDLQGNAPLWNQMETAMMSGQGAGRLVNVQVTDAMTKGGANGSFPYQKYAFSAFEG